jgi:hypothetical protein
VRASTPAGCAVGAAGSGEGGSLGLLMLGLLITKLSWKLGAGRRAGRRP